MFDSTKNNKSIIHPLILAITWFILPYVWSCSWILVYTYSNSLSLPYVINLFLPTHRHVIKKIGITQPELSVTDTKRKAVTFFKCLSQFWLSVGSMFSRLVIVKKMSSYLSEMVRFSLGFLHDPMGGRAGLGKLSLDL